MYILTLILNRLTLHDLKMMYMSTRWSPKLIKEDLRGMAWMRCFYTF